MNRPPEVEPVLRAYLAETGDTAPDRVLRDVAARIALLPRRRAWRLQGRPFVNTSLRLAAGLAAAVVVAVLGWQLLQPAPSTTGSSPAPSAVVGPSAGPSSPAATRLPPLPNGSLAAGAYVLNPLIGRSLQIAVDVPAGWQGYGNFALLGPKGTGSPDGIGIGFIATTGLYGDPCHWDLKGDHTWPQPADIAVGPSVDELVRALAANTAYTTTAPIDTSLNGFRGKQLELRVPSEIAACDKDSSGESRYMVFSGPDGGLYAQGPDWHMQLSIVDAGGTRLIAVLGTYAGTPTADRAAAQQILDSLAITP